MNGATGAIVGLWIAQGKFSNKKKYHKKKRQLQNHKKIKKINRKVFK